MNNSLKCKSLFSLNTDFIENIFSEYEYPWEILPSLKGIIEGLIAHGLDGYRRLTDNVLIGAGVKIADSSHIDGPCIIGHGAVIRHGAYIRSSVIIGDGAVVGNSSEVKNSVMMKNAQAPHFNYVGDSILGEYAHLGAGAICSNLRSDGKCVKIKFRDEIIETGLRKLGAIIGDRVEIGCGSVLCPGTVIGKRTAVYPLSMVRCVHPCDVIVKNDGSVIRKNV